MNRWLPVLSVFVATSLLSAQTEGRSQEPSKIEQRAKEMRDNLDAPKPIRSHVRVEVRLANGNKLDGIVKDGRLVERVDGLRFVEAQAGDKGAGIRLWYSGGANNYVFVPFADFSEYKVLQRLSAKDLVEIEGKMRLEEAAAAEKRRQAEADRKAKAEADAKAAAEAGEGVVADTDPKPAGEGKATAKPKAGGKDAAEAKPTKEQEQQREWFQLLQDYPPADGWNAAKRDEINRKLPVLHVKPTEQEQRFVDKFEDWKKACAQFGVNPEQGNEQAREQETDKKRRK